ncbi:MAG: SDR family oxidoreductase [Phormidesmis sp.]
MRLSQKVALVTSSASGICASTARQLATEGARVMICGRNAAQGRATVHQIRSSGGRASFTLADIAVAADTKAAIDETIATYGRLDILFNHASGSAVRDGVLLEVSEAVWDRVVETTLKGTFFCCQYALPFLQQSGSGTIINLVEQLPAGPMQSVTAVCQGGILAMTGAIAKQFSADAVTANLIWVAEPTATPSVAASDLNLLMAQIPNGTAHSSESTQPFTDIAEAVMYLAVGSSLHGSALIVTPPHSLTL